MQQQAWIFQSINAQHTPAVYNDTILFALLQFNFCLKAVFSLRTYTAFDITCTVGSKMDYWVIAIPPYSRPRSVGYVSNLKIKSWRDHTLDEIKPNSQTVATAGAFGYTLYPVTEEQAHTIPGIGLDMEGIQDKLKNNYMSNFSEGIDNLDTID